MAAAVWALVWLSPGALVSGAEDGSLQGWVLEARSLRPLWLLPGRQGPVWGLAVSGELLASTSGTAGRPPAPAAGAPAPPMHLCWTCTCAGRVPI